MPAFKILSSRELRAEKSRRIGSWVKWSAVILSVTLLAATLLLVNRLRTVGDTVGVPAGTEAGSFAKSH